mmetsp:Transcript_25622/g.37867  ORF Transcript_25622/g.37867 Transcript_25622/m.37867 type:complete len:364 (+) Transcript_25622:129-1220(+)
MMNEKRGQRTGSPQILSFESPRKKPRIPSKTKKEPKKENDLPVQTDGKNKLVSTPSKTHESKAIITPQTVKKERKTHDPPTDEKARRKLAFGKYNDTTEVSENVRLIYRLIRNSTGAIGGNGSFGAIYGELTTGSMQKMVNLMKEHTGLDKNSKFIDVGSGIGKPNLHVNEDPGVDFSYGIEMERSRWLLGLCALKAVLSKALDKKDLGQRCIFEHGNIKQASTFDPFTHVYMFSIGFPPTLWDHLAEMFNNSHSEYLICFHPPRIIIEKYEFEVDLIVQTPTSMHGSSEGHTGYIYKRRDHETSYSKFRCDPLYHDAYELVKKGPASLYKNVVDRVDKELNSGRATRAKKIVHCIGSDDEEE